MFKIILRYIIISGMLLKTSLLFAAVGCTLNDPDRDIVKIFPESTGYKTEFITIKEMGGVEITGEIEEKLKDTLEPTYESIDVPYAYYTILKGKEPIGYVHGVNQKGTYGGMQLILATDLDGNIVDFYYQKISSPEAKVFRSKEFTEQFIGLNLADFYIYDRGDSERIVEIKDLTNNNNSDYFATLRGIRKNLILLDIFKLNRKYDEYFLTEEDKVEIAE